MNEPAGEKSAATTSTPVRAGGKAARTRVRTATVAGGAGAVVVLVLLALAAVRGSVALAVAAVLLGAALVLGACVAVLRTVERMAAASDRRATETRRLEALTREVSRTSTTGLEGVTAGLDDARTDVGRLKRDVKVLRERVPAGFLESLQSDLVDLRGSTRETVRSTFESGIQLGREPRSLLSRELARTLFRDYLEGDDLLELRPLIESFDLLEDQSLTTLRRLYRHYRTAGYWDLALKVVEVVGAKTGRESDAYAVARLEHEIEVFTHPTLVTSTLAEGSAHDPRGPILHMVGRVLPDTQTGYTLRTHYTALAQARRRLPVAVVGQVGITERAVTEIESYTHDGIDYHLLPGEARNHMLLDDWLRLNIDALAELVQRLRPSILHAQSDFLNALIVHVVGTRLGIPTVYESRGFWEESWLSRRLVANRWRHSAETMFDLYGLPAAYTLRKNAEESARLLPDHVFTLADVMRDHILESAHGKIDPARVTLVPNAVESENFPVQEPDRELAAEIGLPENAVVVGYISSMVEYEGIRTLIEAYRLATATSDQPLCLLLVGDGDHLKVLQEQVERDQVADVFFTGRVPHADVLRYYGLIDVFVVPRKKSQVADLVTPLKPFEAFSTGRAVILSDVGALREIADQSRAVETFRADDADDLARALLRLTGDPERRRELGARAARWVRNHRSWDRNVNEYYRVYRQLGYDGPANLVVESQIALEERGVNPGELVEQLAAASLPGLKGWFTIQDIRQSAQSVLDDGWRFASFEPVPVATIEDWARYGREHRSWGFHLHAWEFMDPFLRAYDETGERRWLDEAVRIALSWVAIHRGADDENDPMAWYDMSQSLRLPRLLALALRAARVPDLRDDAVVLAEAVAWHLDELHEDRAFNPNNNHGFYTAVSQVHAAKYAWMFPDASATDTEGRVRLAQMAVSQFAEDGVHLEHSPDYHRMLLASFELAVKDGLIEDPEVKGRVERAARVLGWMVQPDGALVQFGDSPETKMVRPDAGSIDPQTEFILSDGSRGERPTEELAVYPAGGYAFVRSPQPTGPGTLRDSGYLAFSAAFHSRAHKHADDLNVVWFDRGQQILTDGGRFGYGDLLPPDSPLRSQGFYYAAPERQYVEGTMAHNTLMMDGRNQERRTRAPYGSGLLDCSAEDGVFDLSGRVHHADYIHRRRVVYRPGEELLVKDSVFSQSPEPREGTLWFNISGHFELESAVDEGDVVLVATQDGVTTRLVVTGPGRMLEPVRGQTEPLRGWRSRQDRSMEPTWSLGFTFPIETRASVDTRLRLA
ncbi:heparinase II/III family protein [Rothia sp. ARF10]|nr:heparinase II/III family protein [Rothia sp. ARF10]